MLEANAREDYSRSMRRHLHGVCLISMFALFVFILIAVNAAAQDEEAPRVAGPDDVPGADVVWEDGVAYLLDATGSTDNVGIVSYRWEITPPTGASVVLTSTTPSWSWTPSGPGLYKVVSFAADAADNEGARVFVIDVVEVLDAQSISGTNVSYDHSVAIEDGTLGYYDLGIDLTGGMARDPPSYPSGEMLSDAMTYNGLPDGTLAGSWGPYGPSYGSVYLETSRVLIGKGSIANSGSSTRGWTFTFVNVEDLTKYTTLDFWYLQDYLSGRFYDVEFYDALNNKITITPPTPQFSMSGRWYGISVSLDLTHVDTIAYSKMSDLTAVKSFKIYASGSNQVILVDGVGFAHATPGDNMTESATPTGPFGGYWESWTTASKAYVGSGSIYKRVTAASQTFPLVYNWASAVDLSSYNALRFYTWYYAGSTTSSGYGKVNSIQFTDSGGHTALLSITTLPYFHMYEADRYSHWGLATLPLDKGAYTQTGTMDWNHVTKMTVSLLGYRIGDVYIDGWEFYRSTKFKPATPGTKENLAHGIYVMPDGELELTGVTFSPTGPYGGFIKAQGELSIYNTTLEGLWGTLNTDVPLAGSTWGGVITDGARVTLGNVVVLGADSTAFCFINSDVSATSVTVDGVGTGFAGASAMAFIYSGEASGTSARVSLNRCTLTNTATGDGLAVLLMDTEGDVDLDISDLNASGNAAHGVSVSLLGTVGPLDVSLIDSTLSDNGGSGLAVTSLQAWGELGTSVVVSVFQCDALSNSGAGVSVSLSTSILDIEVSISDSMLEGNSGAGFSTRSVDCDGRMTLDLSGTDATGNSGDGVLLFLEPRTFDLGEGPTFPDLDVLVSLSDCSFTDNMGNGMKEQVGTENLIKNPPFPHHTYTLFASGVDFSGNGYNGYYIYEPLLDNDREATYMFTGCSFNGNAGCGLLVQENLNTKAIVTNDLDFSQCTFNDDLRGVEHQFQLAFETFMSFASCELTGNSAEAIYAHDLSAKQRYLGLDYTLEDCDIDDPVRLLLDGAMVEPGVSDAEACYATVSITGCSLMSDYPVRLLLAAQYTSSWATKYLFPMRATVVFTDNTLPASSRSDGLSLELWGATSLDGEVTIKNMTFSDAGNDGVSVFYGVRASKPDHNRMIYGSVVMDKVIVANAQRYGVNIVAAAVNDMMAVRGALARLTDVTVNGATFGARFDGMDAEVSGCDFTRLSLSTIEARDCTVDLRRSSYGGIYEPNLKALDSGKIKLWFDLEVSVNWKGTTEPVVGARVELIDNAYRTFGFAEVTQTTTPVFRDLNALSIVAAGVFTNNPYRLSTSYLGLVQDRYLEVRSLTIATIELVDDVPPILTVRHPVDGARQGSSTIIVEGTAQDVHRSIDRVMVSLDGSTWSLANGKESFSLSLLDVPDGNAIVRVRAYDTANNFRDYMAVVLVDTTPPDLEVLAPQDGLVTNEPMLRVLAATEDGASVTVNGVGVVVQSKLVDRPIELTEGRNIIIIVASDALGNTKQAVITVTLDTQTPPLAVLSPAHRSSGMSSRLHIMGLTEPEGVTVTVAGVATQVLASGTFTADITILPGRNDIAIEVVDLADNRRTVTLTVFLDQEPPTIWVANPLPSTVLADGQVLVQGYVEPGATVSIDGRAVGASEGHFSDVLSLPDGLHVIRVIATDAAGNRREVEVPVTVDTTSPAITVLSPADGLLTRETAVTVSGTVTDDGPGDVKLAINGHAVTVATDGRFELALPLPVWTEVIRIVATDIAGNSASVELTVVSDPDAPFLNVSIAGLETDDATGAPYTRSASAHVTGFAGPGATVTVNGVMVGLDGVTGRFDIDVPLNAPAGDSPASTLVRVVAVDRAGNTAIIERTVERRQSEETAEPSNTTGWAVLLLAIIVIVVAIILLVLTRPRAPREGRHESAVREGRGQEKAPNAEGWEEFDEGGERQ
jgi:hypothetical protein